MMRGILFKSFFCAVWVMNAATLHADWLPTDETGLMAWYKADAGVLTEQNTDNVTTWQDQSGNGYDLSAANNAFLNGSKPVLTTEAFGTGDHPVIQFYQGNEIYSGLTRSVTEPSALFDATKISVYAVVRVITDDFSDPASTGYVASFRNETKGWLLRMSTNGANPIFQVGEPEFGKNFGWRVSGAWYTIAGRFDSADPCTIDVYRDEELSVRLPYVGTSGGLTYPATSCSFNVGLNADADSAETMAAFKGYIAEILIFSDVDDTLHAHVQDYLQQRYYGHTTFPGNDPDLVMWYSADVGVALDPNDPEAKVTSWQDRTGNRFHVDSGKVGAGRFYSVSFARITGRPRLLTETFGGQDHPVVGFVGSADNDPCSASFQNAETDSCGFYGVADAPSKLQDMTSVSTYVVVKNEGGWDNNYNSTLVESWSGSGGWITRIVGQTLSPGIHVGIPIASNQSHFPSNGNWDLVSGTFENANPDEPRMYVNGIATKVPPVLEAPGNAQMTFHQTGQHLSIGGRRLGSYWSRPFNGKIAEILVFDKVDAQHRAQVEAYLRAKYVDMTMDPNTPAAWDLNSDLNVDLVDYAALSGQCDPSPDPNVLYWYDWDDVKGMANEWLIQYEKPLW